MRVQTGAGPFGHAVWSRSRDQNEGPRRRANESVPFHCRRCKDGAVLLAYRSDGRAVGPARDSHCGPRLFAPTILARARRANRPRWNRRPTIVLLLVEGLLRGRRGIHARDSIGFYYIRRFVSVHYRSIRCAVVRRIWRQGRRHQLRLLFVRAMPCHDFGYWWILPTELIRRLRQGTAKALSARLLRQLPLHKAAALECQAVKTSMKMRIAARDMPNA